MLHKKIIFVLILLLLFSVHVSALSPDDLSAKSAIVINSSTKEIVFEKNAYQKRSMASTTKIMTAVLAVESGKMDETVVITPEMCGAEGTSIGLKAGYKIRFYDLLCGLMLESGNDAAEAIAIFLSGKKENFAKKMNEKAAEIGMTNSNFVTPSGLDDEEHYTTAYDMAILGSYAMELDLLREICSSKTKKVDFVEPDITVTFSNHNRLLRSYDGAVGIKTGFTKKSGRCLVSAAERDGALFIAVTLSAGDDWNDHRKMLDFAFESVKREDVYLRFPETVKVMGGVSGEIKVASSEYPIKISHQGDGEITQKVYISPFVYAPLKEGDRLGKAEIFYDGKLMKTVYLTAAENCNAQAETYIERKSIFQKIKDFLGI